MTPEADALWITRFQKYCKHGWHSWDCVLFRNESRHLSSELIGEAVAATRFLWGAAPPDGFVTFVNEDKVRRKRDPGRCYLRAGWHRLEQRTGSGLVVLQQPEAEMPPPRAPLNVLDIGAA